MPLQATRNPEHLSMSRDQIVPNKIGVEVIKLVANRN
jgi:hypothetical protein